jgi:hypothetical protein
VIFLGIFDPSKYPSKSLPMSLDLNAEYEQDRIKELILLLLLFSGSSKPVTIPEVASKNRKRNPKKKEEDSVV